MKRTEKKKKHKETHASNAETQRQATRQMCSWPKILDFDK